MRFKYCIPGTTQNRLITATYSRYHTTWVAHRHLCQVTHNIWVTYRRLYQVIQYNMSHIPPLMPGNTQHGQHTATYAGHTVGSHSNITNVRNNPERWNAPHPSVAMHHTLALQCTTPPSVAIHHTPERCNVPNPRALQCTTHTSVAMYYTPERCNTIHPWVLQCTTPLSVGMHHTPERCNAPPSVATYHTLNAVHLHWPTKCGTLTWM